MKKRESKVELQIWEYAEATGWFQAKIVSPGKNGIMDRVFIGYRVTLWGEIKREGEDASPLQVARAKEMTQAGAIVFLWDNYDDAKSTLDSYRLL